MAGKSPSTVLYEFLSETVAAAANGSVLKDAQVLDSKDQKIDAEIGKGMVVSNSEFLIGPTSVDDDEFYDALLIIGFYWRVPSADWTERRESRDKCFQLAFETARKMFEDDTLGGRVCDSRVLPAVDGSDNSTADEYAIINLPVILNPRSRRDYNLGEARQ